jgi:hypothetical protein
MGSLLSQGEFDAAPLMTRRMDDFRLAFLPGHAHSPSYLAHLSAKMR